MRLPRLLVVLITLGATISVAHGQAGLPRGPVPARKGQVAPNGIPAAPKLSEDGLPGKSIVDLTNRYHFSEHYTSREESVAPGLVGQYQVAVREVQRDRLETPEGPGKPTETTRSTIFVERPAEVSSLGNVTSSIRQYQRMVVNPDEPGVAGNQRLEGMVIWYHPRAVEPPLLLNLTPDRRMSDREFDLARRHIFTPNLVALLPTQSVRVGDTWRPLRKAVTTLFNDSSARSDTIGGRFSDVRRSEDGKTTYAIFLFTGRGTNEVGEITFTAQVTFTFPTPGASPQPGDAPAAKRTDESLVDARGAITELRMGRVMSGVLTGGKLTSEKFRTEHEVILARKLGADPQTGPLKLIEPPAITEANSWLTYVDPKGRFWFQHPQELSLPERYQFGVKMGIDSLVLLRGRPEGRDYVRIDAFAKDPTPESLKEALNAQWKHLNVEVVPGAEEWLPEAEWPMMKVYRIEAALKTQSKLARTTRMHYDAYLIQLTKESAVMVVGTTTRDAVAAFRKDLEQTIRTLRLGKPEGY